MSYEQEFTTNNNSFLSKLTNFIKKVQKEIKHKNIVLEEKSERINYFREDEFITAFLTLNSFKQYRDIYGINEEADILKFINFLAKNNLLVKLKRIENETKKLKYPNSLQVDSNQDYSNKCFYYFTLKIKKSMFWPLLVLTFIILICMFPIWPLQMRVVIFYISLYLLIIITVFAVIRLIIYMLFRIFGYEFWILPDFFENDKIFPLYTFEKVSDNWFGYTIRIFFILLFALYFYYHIYNFETISEITNITKESYHEIVEWGIDKISFNNTYIKDKMISAEEIDEL